MAQNDQTAIISVQDDLAYEALLAVGQLADASARASILDDYRQEQSSQTLRRQRTDLTLFARYLYEAAHAVWKEKGEVGSEPALETYTPMTDDLARWANVTYGLVMGFRRWQLQQRYAIGSINVRMSTVKKFCQLAFQAGYLPQAPYTLIDSIKTISSKTGRNIDEKRGQKSSRKGKKKAAPVKLEPHSCRQLKDGLRVSDDPLAPRDLLLVCLLADQGLRCSEVAALERGSLDLEKGEMRFYRHKVHKTQRHYLTQDTLEACRLYFTHFNPKKFLFEGDPRSARVSADGRTIRPGKTRQDGYDDTSINARLQVLGKRHLGIENLSPHDLRHSWATEMGEKGDIKALQQAGGWGSLQMPAHYIADAEIANKGLVEPVTKKQASRERGQA